jgi:hypothetical protein
MAGAGAADGVVPAKHSPAWYASQILLWVRRARAASASQSLEPLALSALQIGRLYEEGRWRAALGDAAQYVRKVKANRIKAGRRRGRDSQAAARERDKRLMDLAEQVRDKHPRDAKHSTRWLASQLARRLHQPTETIRGRLKPLGIT